MVFVAVVAFELGVMRAISDFTSPDMNLMWLVMMLGLGSQAMVNVLAIGLLIGHRWRESRPFLLGFEAFGIAALVLYITGAILFSEEWIPLAKSALRPLIVLFQDGPYISNFNRMILFSIIGSVLSLPQLTFAAIGGFLTHRRSASRPHRALLTSAR